MHLLVIAAFSPVERRVARSGIALDPEVEIFLEADGGELVGDLVGEIEASEAPLHPLGRGGIESEALSAEPATSLAGNEESAMPALAREETAVRHPNSSIREIRPIAPRPRS